MKTIYVHGRLGQHATPFLFGIKANVKTVREAAQVIEANHPGFYAFTAQMPMEVQFDDQRLCHEKQLDMVRPTVQEIHFRPVEAGQGKVGSIILGIALLASAVFTFGTSLAAGATIGASLGTGLFGSTIAAGFGLTAGISGLMGATILAGALMSPATSDYKSRERPEDRASALINGTVQPQMEGQVVPIALGMQVMCEGTTIHQSLETESMLKAPDEPEPEPEEIPDWVPPYPQGEDLHPGTYGGRGKGDDEPEQPEEGENTLQNKMIYREVRVISEGVIGGLATGDERSIIVNGTPLASMGQDGKLTRNFKGFRWGLRYGTSTQSRFDGFTDVERPVADWEGREVKKGNLDPEYQPLIYTVDDPDVDAVKVQLQTVGPFQHQDDISGSTYGTRVDLEVKTRVLVGETDYVTVAKVVFDGKASAPYPQIIRVPKPDISRFGAYDPNDPDTASWSVTITRITPDTDSRYESDRIDWVGVSDVLDNRNTYPGSALFMFECDSTSFPTIPKVVLRITGISVEVPSNYDAATRTYGPTWDFTWKWSHSANPSYIVRTLLRHYCDPPVPDESLNLAEFYLAGKWCDEEVDDGEGGKEPRYTINEYMVSEEDAIAWLQTLAATYNAQVWYGNSQLSVTQDRPRAAILPVHEGNVVGGQLTYQSTAVSEQITTANVSYHDLSADFTFTPEPYVDEDELTRWKRNSMDITICTTSRGQAARMARYIVTTSKYEDEKITFRGGIQFALAFPGSILAVSDYKRYGKVRDGRILDIYNEDGETRIVLDQQVRLHAEHQHKIILVAQDGAGLVEAPILNWGSLTQIIRVEPLEFDPLLYSTWIITGSDIRPTYYRVISNRQVQDDQWEVTALKYYAAKWGAIGESMLEGLPHETIPKPDVNAPLLPPTNAVVRVMMDNATGLPRAALELSWTPSASPFVTHYLVSYRLNGNPAVQLPNALTPLVTIPDPVPGTYDFAVVAVNVAGRASPPLLARYVHEEGGPSGLLPPQNLRSAQGGSEWTGQDLVMLWEDNPANTVDRGIVAGYQVTLKNADDSIRRIYEVAGNTSTYTYAQNSADGLSSTIKAEVRIIDAARRLSNPISRTFTNPAPAVPTYQTKVT